MNADLSALYDQLNCEFFGSVLPPCEIGWSRRLTRAAGTIHVKKRLIRLSIPLLIEAFEPKQLFAPSFTICGVCCDSPAAALREILKHEMIHLWLHETGKPCGHTAEFRAKAKAIGQPKTRHGIALPLPKSGWIYSCAHCGASFPRRRKFGRARACAPCCRRHNKGKFDERFKLKGTRV